MIKGILFDKDGTLIDYSLWRDAGIKTIETIMNDYKLHDEKLFNTLKKSIGITDTGVEPFGALANKSHYDLATELHYYLNRYKKVELEHFQAYVVKLIRSEVLSDNVVFKEMTDIKSLYRHLNSYGIKMGLVTADSYQSAMHMINKLDLSNSFDFIGSNDGVMKQKPHKDMCYRFCHMYGLHPSEVAVVGDSYSDMLFAKNSGAIGVGVLSGVSSKINLKDVSNVIISTVNSLYDDEVLESLDEESYEAIELCTA